MICTVQDVTHEKRRQVLERIFFHDVLNSAGALLGTCDLLEDGDAEETPELFRDLRDLAGQVVEEIEAQRDLVSAECGELEVQRIPIDLGEFLEGVAADYGRHPVAEGRRIDFVREAVPFVVTSDPRLLRRVVGNLLKNALEASREGQNVQVVLARGNSPEIRVRNATAMSPAVQLQVFQRSFSTKGGVGRGVGTYSVKLLVETYLGGEVSFTSDEVSGTTFTVRLPD